MGSREIVACLVLACVGLVGFVGGLADAPEQPRVHRLSASSGEVSTEARTDHDAVVVFRPEATDQEISLIASSASSDTSTRALSELSTDYENRRLLVHWNPGSNEADRQAFVDRLMASGLVARVERLP